MTLDEIFAAVMIRIRTIQPLYGSIYSMLPKVELDSSICDTMGVSSKQIVYNREFIQSRSIEELVFINLHEVTHYALLHPFRLQGRDRDIFNIACDLYVNALLIKVLGLEIGKTKTIGNVSIKVPADALYSNDIDVDNDSVEDIYDRLIKYSKEKVGDAGTNGNLPKGLKGLKGLNGKYTKDLDYANIGDVATDIDKAKSIITEAITKEKLAGRGDGGLVRVIEKVMCEKVHWEKLVSKFLIDETQKETSYRTTDYRMNYQEAIFPGHKSWDKSKLDKVKICIDTSGSISDMELGVFADAIMQLLKRYKVGAELIYWDTECQSSGMVTDKSTFEKVEIKGCGGTSPVCLFEYFNSKKCRVKPSLVLILTDGYICNNNLSKYSSKYKNTIWLICKNGDKNFKPPFGSVSHLR